MHARTPGGFTDRLSVVAVILAALDIGFGRIGAESDAPWLVRAPNNVRHRRLPWRSQGASCLKKAIILRAAKIDPQHRPVLLIDAV